MGPGLGDDVEDFPAPTRIPPQEWRKSVEVCKWSEQDKSWKKVSNLPVVMSEASANVKHVAEMVADDVFNGNDAVLLDIDYLKIPDTSSTRGIIIIIIIISCDCILIAHVHIYKYSAVGFVTNTFICAIHVPFIIFLSFIGSRFWKTSKRI